MPRYIFLIILLLASFNSIAEETKSAKSTEGQLFDPKQLGIGVGVGAMFLDDTNIKDTTIENGIVRVTSEEDVNKSVWLETHYLIDKYRFGPYTSWGPFLALQVGSENDVFDSIAFGVMVSWKRTPISDTGNKNAFNIGVGWASTKVDVLGDGIEENQSLPTGIESVRTKEIDTGGPVLMFSFSVF
jgi:hypothetical protein